MFGVLYDWRLRIQKKAESMLSRNNKRKLKTTEKRYRGAGNPPDAVKGVARRVIIVKTPDPRIFEEAIFVVREEYMNEGGVSASDLVREARTAADGYIETTIGRPPSSVRPWLLIAACVAAGSVFTVVIWFALSYLAPV